MYSLGLLICTLFPSVLARGGKGEGGEGIGGGAGDVADGISNATSNLSLEPLLAATFAFYVIFAVFFAYQTVQAAKNMSRRISKEPPTIALPEYSVGPIFPAWLLLSTLTLTVYNVLVAINIGLTDNQNVSSFDRPELPPSFLIAQNAVGYINDVLIISSAFALLAHREKVLVATPKVVRGTKIIFDLLLTAALLAVSMLWVGSFSAGITSGKLRMAKSVYLAYYSLLFIAAVDIAVTSVVLYLRTKRSSVKDHKIMLLMAAVVSPSLVLYALYPIILWCVPIIDTVLTNEQVGLASVVVDSITLYTITWTYLGLGMPPTPKQKNIAQEP